MERNHENFGICELCERDTTLTFHHLIPRKLHRRPFFKKNYKKEVLRQGIHLCELCHTGIHRIHNENALGKQFYNLELLKEDPAIQKHYKWVSKQKSIRD